MAITQTLPEHAGTAELGANWRVQFMDADGIPLNMVSFEQIDFGAISYKEIFQNVKTILATPLYSAALERTLGVDQSIVDRPMGEASYKVIAILDAITYWEPRVEVMNIDFDYSEALNGHLIVKLQLKIKNVIYGSNKRYGATNIFQTPTKVVSPPIKIEPVPGIQGPPGATGEAGTRGSLWFTGTTAPPSPTVAMKPMVRAPAPGPAGEQGEKGQRGFVWLQGTGDPVTPQKLDMYLNTTNGDVWQFDGTQWRKTTR
jgi:phage baseplate assembly protein W